MTVTDGIVLQRFNLPFINGFVAHTPPRQPPHNKTHGQMHQFACQNIKY